MVNMIPINFTRSPSDAVWLSVGLVYLFYDSDIRCYLFGSYIEFSANQYDFTPYTVGVAFMLLFSIFAVSRDCVSWIAPWRKRTLGVMYAIILRFLPLIFTILYLIYQKEFLLLMLMISYLQAISHARRYCNCTEGWFCAILNWVSVFCLIGVSTAGPGNTTSPSCTVILEIDKATRFRGFTSRGLRDTVVAPAYGLDLFAAQDGTVVKFDPSDKCPGNIAIWYWLTKSCRKARNVSLAHSLCLLTSLLALSKHVEGCAGDADSVLIRWAMWGVSAYILHRVSAMPFRIRVRRADPTDKVLFTSGNMIKALSIVNRDGRSGFHLEVASDEDWERVRVRRAAQMTKTSYLLRPWGTDRV